MKAEETFSDRHRGLGGLLAEQRNDWTYMKHASNGLALLYHVSEAPEGIIRQCEYSPSLSHELQALQVSVSHTGSCCRDSRIAMEAVKVNRCSSRFVA